MAQADTWPSLPFAAWRDTCATLHMWPQVVGKIRLGQAPPLNHWWQVPLYVTSRGLTTPPMPSGARALQIDFDFIYKAAAEPAQWDRAALERRPAP